MSVDELLKLLARLGVTYRGEHPVAERLPPYHRRLLEQMSDAQRELVAVTACAAAGKWPRMGSPFSSD